MTNLRVVIAARVQSLWDECVKKLNFVINVFITHHYDRHCCDPAIAATENPSISQFVTQLSCLVCLPVCVSICLPVCLRIVNEFGNKTSTIQRGLLENMYKKVTKLQNF